MAGSGVCCSSLEEPKALMKMGLSLVLIGHVNFLLGALVHGVVLRYVNLQQQARAMEYAISNVVALASGLLGIVVGILAIVLSKNKKSKGLTWSLFSASLAAALMASASAIGLTVSVVQAVLHGGRSLLIHCRPADAVGFSSVTDECPFDPTRIYSTTLILWVPLVVTCVVQLVFSARCFSACVSFLGLPCRPRRRRRRDGRAINVVRPLEEVAPPLIAKPKPCKPPPDRYTDAPRSYGERAAEQRRPPPPPQRPPPQHRSLPPSERRPLRRPSGERSDGERRTRQQHGLLQQRGALERSSFWV